MVINWKALLLSAVLGTGVPALAEEIPAPAVMLDPAAQQAYDETPTELPLPEEIQPILLQQEQRTQAAPPSIPPALTQPAAIPPLQKKPTLNPWKPLFFENDFSYVGKPGAPTFFGEELKNIPLGDGSPWTFSTGGELRHRYMDEDNRLRPGGPGRSTYNLWRWRNYLNLEHKDYGRIFIEGIDSSSFGEDLPVTPIDENRWDLLNAFVDFYLSEDQGRAWVFRAGRQELLYGSQHLVSPLDWGNTRRNFEGLKLFSRGEDWDLDFWVTRPVNAASGNGLVTTYDNTFDNPDQSRTFSGAWFTYKGLENNLFDLYWLWLREQQPVPGLTDGSRQTVGSRWVNTMPIQDGSGKAVRSLVFELEGAYQFGHDNDSTGFEREVSAGFTNISLTHNWLTLPWSPSVGGLFYYGSGDSNLNDGENNTFSVLFPLGHAYWGFIDNLSGQNLLDYSVFATVKPTEKLVVASACHWFQKATNGDFIYNVAGVPVGAAPGFGSDIGNEFDLVGTYTFNPNFNVQVGGAWFWYGDAVTSNPALTREDATFYYVQSTLRY